MINVRFIQWEARVGGLLLTTWHDSTYWVPRNEQVWIHGTRYEVIRVEHIAENEVSCFVRGIN